MSTSLINANHDESLGRQGWDGCWWHWCRDVPGVPAGQQGQDLGHFRLCFLGFSHCLLVPLLAYSVVETCLNQAQEETSNLRVTATIPLLSHLLVVPKSALSKE